MNQCNPEIKLGMLAAAVAYLAAQLEQLDGLSRSKRAAVRLAAGTLKTIAGELAKLAEA
jgi:hypothetical protein